MIVVYRHPDSCPRERRYLVGWLVEEVFGWELRCETEERTDQSIEVEGREGALAIPDSFFSRAAENWLGADTLPSEPLPKDEEGTPMLYSDDGVLDVVGSLFFLLSRYEEAAVEVRDEHDRFPSEASVLRREGLLSRAIGNEYIEALWADMLRRWPDLKRRERSFRMRPSHDIDHPSKYWGRWREVLRAAGHKMRTGRIGEGTAQVWHRLGYDRWIKWQDDPYETVTWLIETSEKLGLQNTFYFIPFRTDATRDPAMPLTHPHVEDQWKRIAGAGHDLGVHPGYGSYDRADLLVRSAEKIRTQLARLGIEQEEIGGRQHFLRWRTPITARGYESAGLSHDSSMGFADHAGFRCGVCYEFPWYDVVERRPMKLRERPLVLMEVTMLRNEYMGLGLGAEGFDYAKSLKDECRRYQGDFSLLWHNNELETEEARDFYAQLLAA